MNPAPIHAVVLGAGLMGRLLACTLAQKGHRVSLYDAGPSDASGSAARVAAAMLAPLAESAVAEMPVVRMGQYALARWPQLLAELPLPVFFQQTGTLVVWHRQDAAEASRFGRQIAATQQKLPSLPHAIPLDGKGIQAIEPAMGQRFAQGLLLPQEGQLDNRQLLAALLQQLQSPSLSTRVALFWNTPRQPEDFVPNQKDQPAKLGPSDWLFDCRGLGARASAPGVAGAHPFASGLSGLRGVRGEVIRVHAPEVTLNRPLRLIHPRYPLYIAPKQDHVFVIGATEIESDDLSPMSVRSALELLSAAYSVHSGFAEARILEMATQCRPALPDNLPSIRLTAARVMQINGLYRHGFLIAPALLDMALELMQTGHSALAEQMGLKLDTTVTLPGPLATPA